MLRQKQVTQEWIECDGCDYVIGDEDHMVVLRIPRPWAPIAIIGAQPELAVLDITPARHAEPIELHFHPSRDAQGPHDCFRYWAHSVHIMRKSLKARGATDPQIEEFLSTYLYRDEKRPHSPGVARPKEEVK